MIEQELNKDYLGKDLKIGNQVVYYSMDGFRKGFIKNIDTEIKMVIIANDEKTFVKPYNQVIQI